MGVTLVVEIYGFQDEAIFFGLVTEIADDAFAVARIVRGKAVDDEGQGAAIIEVVIAVLVAFIEGIGVGFHIDLFVVLIQRCDVDFVAVAGDTRIGEDGPSLSKAEAFGGD